jgi:hypothetical protein
METIGLPNKKRKARFVAQYTLQLRPSDDGNPEEYLLHIGMTAQQYLPVTKKKDIRDSALYIVGDLGSASCFHVSSGKARKLCDFGYPVRSRADGRKHPMSWIKPPRKIGDEEDGGDEEDRIIALSRFCQYAAQTLRDAGFDVEQEYEEMVRTKNPGMIDRKVNNSKLKKRLGISVPNKIILPFMPFLPDGTLHVVDQRHHKNPDIECLVECIRKATAGTKYPIVFTIDHGELRSDVTLRIVAPHEINENGSMIRVIHDNDFYEANKDIPDPHQDTIDQSIAMQHITDSTINEHLAKIDDLTKKIIDEEDKKAIEKAEKAKKQTEAGLSTTWAVATQELAMKQMLAFGMPWRRFVAEPLWPYLADLSLCAPGIPGKKRTRWIIHFPADHDSPVISTACGYSCWHDKYSDNEFLWSWEKGDPNNHHAFLRKDGVVIMFRIRGVDGHIIYDDALLHVPHQERINAMKPIFGGVHRAAAGDGLFYVAGPTTSFNNMSGAKRHPSSFHAWIIEGTKEQAMAVIEPLMCGHTTHLGSHPARPFVLRLPRMLQSLYDPEESVNGNPDDDDSNNDE